MAVEVLERQPGELGLHVAAHPVDRALRHPGHGVALTPTEQSAQEIKESRQAEAPAELSEIDAPSGSDVHA